MLGAILGAVLFSHVALAQSATNLEALKGLAPVAALENSAAGKAALKANLEITGAIQQGAASLPMLLPFHDQQQQALRDAVITWGNAFQLTDALGSKLGGAYQSLTSFTSPDDGKTTNFTNVSPNVAKLIGYASATTNEDAGSGKYFFANATTDGKTPVSPEAAEILKSRHGVTDIFGKAYDLPAGTTAADPYGDSRPYQTEPEVLTYKGKDYFGVTSDSVFYLHGPTQNLTASPSYPSGHTTYGYTESLLLALLIPERYPQLVARGAEYGNDRIVLGAHYAMDVLGGRTLAIHDLAQLLANKPGYVGVDHSGVKIDDFRQALADARADLRKALEAVCREPIPTCAEDDQSRFALLWRVQNFYEGTQTYGLPSVFPATSGKVENVGKLAPEAGNLLIAAFPYLTLKQADDILTITEGPGGGFLDDGSAFGVYSRLDLFRASRWAIALDPATKPGPAIKPKRS
jgi:hypothetical protein